MIHLYFGRWLYLLNNYYSPATKVFGLLFVFCLERNGGKYITATSTATTYMQGCFTCTVFLGGTALLSRPIVSAAMSP